MFNPTTGEYLPQKPVVPNFDNDFITKTLNEFVEQEKTKQIQLQPKMDKAIERIEKEVIGMQHEQFADRLREKITPTYEELVKKKPVRIVDVRNGIKSDTYANMKKAVMEKAQREKWFDVPHRNDDTESFIFLTKDSFNHAYSNLTAAFGEDTIRCMAHIPEIIKEAILTYVDEPKNARKMEKKVYTFFGAVNGIKSVEPVKLTVKAFDVSSLNTIPQNIREYFERAGIDDEYISLYDVKALEVVGIESIKKETDASAKVGENSRARGTSDSYRISVSELFKLVNGDATKYLPKELQFSDREIDSWLDDLSVDDLLELLRSEIDEQKKEKTTRRVDEVNKMLKQIGLEFNGTKQAAWTDERIENYLSCSYYGSSNPNYAQAYITYMTPKQFLDLTMGGETTTVERIKKESDSYGAVDFEKLGESSPIFLEINEGKNWSRVIGHEGRHRMYLLGKAGFEKIPVLVFDYSTKYDKAAKDEMKLIAQRFNDTDLISRARNTSVHDVIPFSQGNKELIKQKFGPSKDADIYYSDRDSDYIGPRTLLTNALETVAQTTEEKELLTEYRKDIDILGIKESELAAIKSEIKELSFAKGKRDTQRLDYLQKRAEKLQSSINWYDKKLLNMEAAAPLKAVVDRERAKAKKKAYEKSREYARERMTSYKEGVEKKAKIDSITQKTTMLAKWMKTPTKDKHIPDDLKGPVKDLLAAIDFASKNVGLDTSGQSEALAKLSGSVQDAKKNLGLRANLIALQMATVQSEEMKRAGVDFSSDIEKLSNSIGDMELKSGELFVLKDMSLEDLVALDKVVTTLRTVIKKTNEYYTLRRKITNTAAAHELFDLFDSLGTASVGKLDGVANFFNYDNITPINFFDRLGDVGKDLFHAFAKSQDRMAFLAKKTKEFAEGTWTARDVKKWDSDLIEFEVVDAKKTVDPDKPVMKKVYTTTSRLMTLYLHDKREQSRYHLYDGGGGRFTTFEHGLKTYGEDVNGVALSKELVQQMLQKLDPKAKEVADAISEFFNIFCKDLGNEVTLDMYGTELFVEDNYVPIEVIEESVSRQMEKPARSITALLNKGFTKEAKPNAHNQIVLDSIFNVFSKHASEMISYNAFARTVYDAVRLFEYKETRKSYALNKEHGQPVEDNLQTKMKGALGDGAVKYFRNFLEDVNGTQIAGRGDNMLGKAFSNAKLANVAWSLNVALLQPLSLIRATTMVNPIYLAKGTFKIRHGIEKAMEKSGVALWKSFGYRDTDISKSLAEQIKNNKTFGDKMKEWSMKAPEIMDEISWGALWSACEYQVLADNKGIEKGSQKFYDEVSDLFEEVVYRTQVMDSVLSRSQIMRNKSGMVKGLTSYMAEPLVTYNMVYGIFSQWNLDSRKGDNFDSCFKRHGKKLTVAIGAYGLSALAEAGIRTLTTAMKNAGDDDDDEVFKEQLIDNLNPLNKIPIARELVSALQGYGVSSIPGLDTVEAFVNAYKAISKMIFEGDKVSYKKVQKILKAISYGSGQGMSNATKEVVAIWNLTIGQAYPSLFIDISK